MSAEADKLRAARTAAYLALLYPPYAPGWQRDAALAHNTEVRAEIARLTEELDKLVYGNKEKSE